ncbi:hypothetical protein [Schaalia suimastitidis]|uniref:hypothetical protein n=1 Tax=Schaalia suimastitidis TaxID=121163 RepID=UPI0003F728C9|nr:hypothetical protein [Schaalia suimastitidis]
MTGFALLMLFVPFLFLALATGALAFYALRRRPLEQWAVRARDAVNDVSARTETDSEPIRTRTVSFAEMMNDRSVEGSAYVDPSRLPGFTQVEGVATRLEERYRSSRNR